MKKVITKMNYCPACLITPDGRSHQRLVRVSWRDHDAAHEVPLEHRHRLVAADPPLGLAVLRGLRDWEQGRVYSKVWVGAGRYRAGKWAMLGQTGYTGAEDEGIWARMVGGDWDGEETIKEESQPPRPNHHPPHSGHQKW